MTKRDRADLPGYVIKRLAKVSAELAELKRKGLKHEHPSPCVSLVTPTCVYLKDGTKVVPVMRGVLGVELMVIPQSVIRAQEPLGLHSWIQKHGHWVCSKCGFVRRADGKNKPCPGVVKITTRVKAVVRKVSRGKFRPITKDEVLTEMPTKPKKYPEVDRFIQKKRKVEKEQVKYGGFYIGDCKKCNRYGPISNTNGICHGCGGFAKGRKP